MFWRPVLHFSQMPIFPIKSKLDDQGRFLLSQEDLHHLSGVLRVSPGGRFKAIDQEGRRYLAYLVKEAGSAYGQVWEVLQGRPASRLPLHLAVALIRWSRLEFLVEKATELGVMEISLLTTAYTKHQDIEKISINKINRLNKIAKETLKQCERPLAPQIHPPKSLVTWLKELESPREGRLHFDEKITEPILSPDVFKKETYYTFVLGPEGGFHEEERTALFNKKFHSFSLGGALLRMETAALYGASLLKGALGG